MRKLFLFYLGGMLILTSCKRTEPVKNSPALPFHVEVEQNLRSTKSIPLSSLGNKIEYITLETKPECLIRHISGIAFTGSYIFVSDNDRFFEFDRKGTLVRQIGSKGRGPEEYLSILDFWVNEEMNSIFVLSDSKMIVYDFDGKFKNYANLDFFSMRFVKDRSNFIFYIGNIPVTTNDPVYSWIVTDMKAKILFRLENYHKRIHRSVAIGVTPLYSYNGIAHFMEFGSDTVFYLKDTIPEPYALIKLGDLKIDPDAEPTEDRRAYALRQSKKLWTYDINEDSSYIFMSLLWGFTDSLEYCVFNKENMETTILKGKGLINDLDGGMPFWPRYIYNDSILVDNVDAITLKEYVVSEAFKDAQARDLKKKSELKKLADSLDETDNPILIIVTPQE